MRLFMDYDGTLVNSQKALYDMYPVKVLGNEGGILDIMQQIYTSSPDFNWKLNTKWNMSDSFPFLYGSQKQKEEFLELIHSLARYEKNPSFLNVDIINFCNLANEIINSKGIIPLFEHEEFFKVVEYYPLAKEALTIFNSINGMDEIIICTTGTPKNLAHKLNYVSKDFPFASFLPIYLKDSNGVGKAIIDMKDSIFVDDHIDNLKSSNAKYKILFKEENNHPKAEWQQISEQVKKQYDIKVAHNWKEIFEIVNNIV